MRARTLIVISSLLTGLSAAASTWTIHERDLDSPGSLTSQVARFNEGDVVVFHGGDGSTRRFTLGARIGEGEGVMGKVFSLAGSEPPEVVKFQTGSEQSRRFMLGEIEAIRALRGSEIPHVPVIEANAKFFLTKRFETGMTLDHIVKSFDRLSFTERARAFEGIIELFEKLGRRSSYFTDLHGGNIIYVGVGTPQAHWKVLDPGFIAVGDGAHSMELFKQFINPSYAPRHFYEMMQDPDPRWLEAGKRVDALIETPPAARDRAWMLRLAEAVPENLEGSPTALRKFIGDTIGTVAGELSRVDFAAAENAPIRRLLERTLRAADVPETWVPIAGQFLERAKSPAAALDTLEWIAPLNPRMTENHLDNLLTNHFPEGFARAATNDQLGRLYRLARQDTPSGILNEYYRRLGLPAELKNGLIGLMTPRTSLADEYFLDSFFQKKPSPAEVRKVAQLVLTDEVFLHLQRRALANARTAGDFMASLLPIAGHRGAIGEYASLIEEASRRLPALGATPAEIRAVRSFIDRAAALPTGPRCGVHVVERLLGVPNRALPIAAAP